MSSITSLLIKNDVACFFAINRKIHCRFLNIFMKAITQIGSTPFAILASLVLLYYKKSEGIFFIINLIGSQIIIHALKRLINRPRPYKTLDWVIALNPPKCKYSLPSGHSSSALSLALSISLFFPLFRPLFIAVALLVGISRVYLGYHYPTDVSIGFLISFSFFKTLGLFL